MQAHILINLFSSSMMTGIPSIKAVVLAIVADTFTRPTPSGRTPWLTKYVHLFIASTRLTTSISKGRNTHDRFKDDWSSRKNDSGYSSRVSRDLNSPAEHHRGKISRGGRDKEHIRNRSSSSSWSAAAGDHRNPFGSTPLAGKPTESNTPTLGGWGSASTAGDTSTKDLTGEPSGWNVGGWDDCNKGDGLSSNPWGGASSAWGNSSWDDNAWGGSNEDKAQQSKMVKANESNSTLPTNQSAPGSPSILAKSPAMSRIRRSSDQEGTLARPPSPPKVTTSEPRKPTTSSFVSQDMDAAAELTSAPSPTIRRTRLPLPTRSQKQIPSTAVSVQEVIDDKRFPPPSPIAPQDWSEIPLSESITGRIQQDDLASDASGHISVLAALTLPELHSKVIKYVSFRSYNMIHSPNCHNREIIHAVLIRHDLLKAEERKDRWRRARQSSCYHHSTPAAQKILESTNHKHSEELSKLNKRLSLLLKKIVWCSDLLNAHWDLVEKGLNMKKVMLYTAELRDWIADLELSRRVFTATSMIDGEKKAQEAVKKQWKDEVIMLRNTVHELELTVTDISDDLVHLQNTQTEKFQELFHTTEKAMEEEILEFVPDMENLLLELGVGMDAVIEIKKQIKATDQRAAEHIPRVEELKVYIKALEEEVADLMQKEKEISKFHEEAGAKIKQIEIWKKADKTQLDQLSKNVEALHQQQYLYPEDNYPFSSCGLDGHLPYTDALVTLYVVQEIKPTLDSIMAVVDTSSYHLTAQFNRLVEQVVMKTFDLVQMALKVNGFVTQVHPISV
ncbi:hypothetical protein D9756_005886 [Leucocoprinus leucothites]|uniref:Uncharacterized protein n=1 Tax=Leucocoprinus leucothites TaxID=201217 RepID=A0A8H5FXM5_9AGAR|nr:hypothetical protein D9756_005886 [Leucoagaricus leucothites]